AGFACREARTRHGLPAPRKQSEGEYRRGRIISSIGRRKRTRRLESEERRYRDASPPLSDAASHRFHRRHRPRERKLSPAVRVVPQADRSTSVESDQDRAPYWQQARRPADRGLLRFAQPRADILWRAKLHVGGASGGSGS